MKKKTKEQDVRSKEYPSGSCTEYVHQQTEP